MCTCENCKTEGYFEFKNGFIPDNCIYKNFKPSTTAYEDFDHIED